jgi:hypothetical protein
MRAVFGPPFLHRRWRVSPDPTERRPGSAHCQRERNGFGEHAKMLKLSLVILFVVSLATLSFASSLMPVPQDPLVASLN